MIVPSHLRHTCAALMIALNLPLLAVRDRPGYSTIQVTADKQVRAPAAQRDGRRGHRPGLADAAIRDPQRVVSDIAG
ncbi:MAG: hypothetical protein WD794_02850 [Mycobacteriales bacterium]